MSPTWSHLTSPPQPPFPVPVSDNVFLPIPSTSPTSPLRTSTSEPTFGFVLKGLGVLQSDEKEKEVKISEVKTRRRNTLLVTPGEVTKVRSLTFVQPPRPSLSAQSSTASASTTSATARPSLPRTPQPQPHPRSHLHMRGISDISTPSTSFSRFDDRSNYDSCTDQSAFSTPTSGYASAKDASSPCPIASPRPLQAPIGSPFSFPVSAKKSNRNSVQSKEHNKFKFWRSPPPPSAHIHSSPFEDQHAHGKLKRRKVSAIDWEGLPVPEELVSPKTVMRVNELGSGLMWTSLA
ncbi:hypothetical protein I316_07968 [Kwoniella heveanensis BCC8398]|uniref:Uncharacterized protein n=1 Tax=Kwoniella heveanensis BCC8398 TaxID=1296120 RepID=A0A1B9GH85_9TREE|nr:hypothetical protein I316_07968 [Kwoniella heveanensis BCC8398]